jgi:hypothetical protein
MALSYKIGWSSNGDLKRRFYALYIELLAFLIHIWVILVSSFCESLALLTTSFPHSRPSQVSCPVDWWLCVIRIQILRFVIPIIEGEA